MAQSKRRWFAPEVVQTTSMDCGPATLKCLLEGYGINVSYGRLREACQTSVDGTSIDAIENVANDLGLHAEQQLIPVDHIFEGKGGNLPAIVVVRHVDLATHFVVAWRKQGARLQIMDPAIGRRKVPVADFLEETFRHSMTVPATDWREWAGSPDFLEPLASRIQKLGISRSNVVLLSEEAQGDSGWFSLGALDAATRMVQELVEAGGIGRGREAMSLLHSLFHQTVATEEDIFTLVPREYWFATPDAEASFGDTLMLRITGAVVVRVLGRRSQIPGDDPTPDLAPELVAALHEAPQSPVRQLFGFLREDGALSPVILMAALAVGAVTVMLEALLFRGLFDIAAFLALPSQRAVGAAAIVVFLLLLFAIEFPIVMHLLRMGRHLEVRLRMALLGKLTRLNDRYFQSRPISDMADRNHNIRALRNVPSLGAQLFQTLFELVLTLAAVIWLAPHSMVVAILLAGLAIAIPIAAQKLVNERDLRVRNQGAALGGFYLDALIGLMPIHAHNAEASIRREHESLLVEWSKSMRRLIAMTLGIDTVQAFITTALMGWLVIQHFLSSGSISGADLLLVYWAVKLPLIGNRFGDLILQYPAQRNILMRLFEPLSAPEEAAPDDKPLFQRKPAAGGMGIEIEGGTVQANGHVILRDVNLSIAPGEHVTIVGVSGAGKSTLVGLMLGWHRLSEGSIRIDGELASDAHIASLRNDMAWVDPAIQIWNRSLLDNIQFAARDENMDGMSEVIAASQLRTIVERLPRGMQSTLGEGGCQLSGGEGQRVRLARALFGDGCRLALLDEPFRGLDRSQRRALLSEVRTWWADRTLICVTHDLEETVYFPRVIIVEDGRIVEDGEPRVLAQADTRYRELLFAETRLRDFYWERTGWRNLEVSAGKIAESAL